MEKFSTGRDNCGGAPGTGNSSQKSTRWIFYTVNSVTCWLLVTFNIGRDNCGGTCTNSQKSTPLTFYTGNWETCWLLRDFNLGNGKWKDAHGTGDNSQKSISKTFYIADWVARWLLRISTGHPVAKDFAFFVCQFEAQDFPHVAISEARHSCQKRPTLIERDLQKRPTCAQDFFEFSSRCYIWSTTHMSNETHINRKRPAKDTCAQFVCQFETFGTQKDKKKKFAVFLCVLSFGANSRPFPTHCYVSSTTHMPKEIYINRKRPAKETYLRFFFFGFSTHCNFWGTTHMSKETYIYRKRPVEGIFNFKARQFLDYPHFAVFEAWDR